MVEEVTGNFANSDWKKFKPWHFILYIIIPALITGFFTIIPSIIEKFGKNKASLEYTITSGPSFREGQDYRRILVAEIRNNGSTILSDIEITMRPQGGRIEAFAVDQRLSIIPINNTDLQSVRSFRVANILPNERVLFNLILQSNDNEPNVTLRAFSGSVVATEAAPESRAETANRSIALAALAAGIGSALVGLFFSAKAAGKIPFLRKEREERKK